MRQAGCSSRVADTKKARANYADRRRNGRDIVLDLLLDLAGDGSWMNSGGLILVLRQLRLRHGSPSRSTVKREDESGGR